MHTIAQDGVRVARTGDKLKVLPIFYVPLVSDRTVHRRPSCGIVQGTIMELPISQSSRNAQICSRVLGSPVDIPYFVMVSSFLHFLRAQI